jgi:DNA-binding NarL/FixJ family response regulator
MRIMLADAESNVRYGLTALLEGRPELEVIGEAADAEGLLNQAQATCPDLVLLDWELPGLVRDDRLGALRRAYPNVYIIVLCGRPEVRESVLAAGADAFISKADPPELLLEAITAAKRAGATF